MMKVLMVMIMIAGLRRNHLWILTSRTNLYLCSPFCFVTYVYLSVELLGAGQPSFHECF